MERRGVFDFNSGVLAYLKAVGEGTLPLDPTQLAELPPDLGKDVASQAEDVVGTAAMARLTGRPARQNSSKVDMNRLLRYFSSEAAGAESPLLDNALDRPLSNYFINCSHNTYLTGNQLYGNASTEAYRIVLRHGCRSIEIDVWDGKPNEEGEKGPKEISGKPPSLSSSSSASSSPSTLTTSSAEPRVLHGYTLTKEVSFRDVCRAIGDSAFVTTDLPIIVSLEVHAHAEQQEKMVQIMQETWTDKLVPTLQQECLVLPSPADLRGKILVKVKGAAISKPEEVLETLEQNKAEDSQSASEDDTSLALPSESMSKSGTRKSKKSSKIIAALSSLGVYTRAYHFKDFIRPEASLPTHVFSLSEKKVMTVHQNDGPSLFRHNRDFMMRAFPSGSRVTSSNLDPPVYWRKGIQMAALNWQKIDASIMLNHAMFSGSPGWVLKPEGYRGSQSAPINQKTAIGSFTIKDSTPLASIRRYTLDLVIEMLAAQSLPPAKHPYVKCELHVETPQERKGEWLESEGKEKESEHKRRTKVSKTLDFNRERMEFIGIREIVPPLSFVRFKVMDDVLGPDELIAWGCIRLDRLKPGLRFIHLLDTHGHDIDAVLLVNTQVLLRD